MDKQFFEKIFPSQGTLCVAGIDTESGHISHRFADNVEDALEHAEKLIAQKLNVYFTPGSYMAHRRKQELCVAVKCFFLDLDVMHGKDRYLTKEAALNDIERFCSEIDWPLPVIIDSGGGIHAYWVFNEEVEGQEWKEWALRFKTLCLERGMIIDQGVPADSARLMRMPGTHNYRYNPPSLSSLLSNITTHDFNIFKPALESVQGNAPSVLASIEKGLDEDTKAIYEKRNGNFEYDFHKIVNLSLEGNGCEQIKFIIENAATCPEPLWYAGLSVAVRCRDGKEAIHRMSEDYPEYSYDETERKAAQSLREAKWAHGCKAFADENFSGCKGCPHSGRITGPIELGKVIRVAEQPTYGTSPEDEAIPVRNAANPEKIYVFPDYLNPYQRGVNGGVYFMPPPRRDKKGKLIQDDPELMTPNDLYPVKRLYSVHDGECLVMHLHLPMDQSREFLLPLKDVVAQEKLKTILASNGVIFEPTQATRLASYLMKWTAYLVETQRADVMRVQQGWTENQDSFVVGTQEISKDDARYCPPSPLAKNVVRSLKPTGEFATWKECIQMFNDPGYELHAFTVLCGLASPLMEVSNVNGVTVSLYSEGPGTGKTGALYGALSVWGKPDSLAVYDATGNGLIQRMVTSKNLPFGLDEQGDLDPKLVSHLLYNVSSGAPKIRLMSSTNQEREAAFNTKLIAIMTTNKPMKSLLQEYRANTSAQAVRILEPEVRIPNHPGYELTAERGKAMFDPLKYNYGHAGLEFIKEIVRNIGIVELRRRLDMEYMKVAQRYTNNSEYRFLSNLLATARLAGDIGNKIGLFAFDLDRIFNAVGAEFDAVVEGKRRDDAASHEDIVGDFINKNIQNCLVIRDGKVTMEPRQALYIRAEVDKGVIYVSTSAMKQYLRDIRMDIRQFETRLTKKEILLGKVRKQMASGWKDAIGVTNVHAYELAFSSKYIFDEQESEQPA